MTSPTAESILAHYGVKGMRWGKRKAEPTKTVSVTQKGKKLSTSGGEGLPASAEAKSAAKINQVAKASGVKALSNKELQEYATRIQLEQNVKRLQVAEKSPVKRFIAGLLKDTAQQQARSVVQQQAASQVAGMMAKKK